MIIDCISDLHGYYPNLEGGDLLILAGDLTANDTDKDWVTFEHWLNQQDYREKIIIAGNHDNFMQSMDEHRMWKYWEKIPNVTYLCDSDTEFEGLKIWGSPWTQWFHGVNPKCKAFMLSSDEKLSKKWALIPDDVDILITHSPPYGTLDKTIRGECVGSKSLHIELALRLSPKLFVCGHIHESYGIEPKGGFIQNAVNASHVNEHYQPVNKPIRIEL